MLFYMTLLSVVVIHELTNMLSAKSGEERNQSFVLYGQATKRIRWMPWQSEAMKDVGTCDKFRGGGNQPLIRKFPNGGTHLV